MDTTPNIVRANVLRIKQWADEPAVARILEYTLLVRALETIAHAAPHAPCAELAAEALKVLEIPFERFP